MVDRGQITGLILAGGQGSRLGGVDKGLQVFAGQPLALHALQRLSPQVDRVMISANRHLDVYAQMRVPVWPDPVDLSGYEGPLAGFLAGLQHCETAYMVTVPCDCPHFPTDLVQRLSKALTENQADLAVARTPLGLEPAFCLIKCELQASLLSYMQSGQRKIERWTEQHRRAEVAFDDDSAFFNINTPDDLARA
ncbi:MAG: molybdenum cofactor guanylyltransferase MobA [Rhizobacter sp.]|nr:molybdenum cofactor guanylyltransferase MobA [Rhizobacter sp.]